MQLQTIRSALGELQNDSDQSQAWQSLESALAVEGTESDESSRILAMARQEHQKRREWDAVGRLLGFEARLSQGTAREAERLRQEAKVLRENLLEEGAAVRLYERIIELAPGDAEALAALEESRQKREGWEGLVQTYLAEADKAPDDLYRSSMLMRAAEVELRFGAEDADAERVLERLQRSLKLDPRNERASEILELVYRRVGDYASVVEVLRNLVDSAESRATRIAAGLRAARVSRHRLRDESRAAAFYRRVLEFAPTHSEALAFLSEYYSGEERWDDLVQVYEASLSGGDQGNRERLGDLLQVAMLLWRKRQDPTAAATWFERVRKLDPANQGMLDFYREYYAAEEDAPQLLTVLSAAQRVLPSGKEKQAITAEIAHLAAGHKDAQKAIEQYKNLLRQDPENAQALAALKQLYHRTQGYLPLVELLRQQLERTPLNDTTERLAILREVADLYRGPLASDTALVSVLHQIAQLDAEDVVVARELVVLYEKLGRWRDLLTSQQRLATLTSDRGEKIELMRAAGRRWLDQFSNVQNATQAFESLLEVAPDDREARDRLRELYKKRRSWESLYKLYEGELKATTGAEHQELLQEMARLAAERLGRGNDATRLYREILESDPGNSDALGALERQAERGKDWSTLADALERRVGRTDDTAAKIAVLQKLGAVYSEHLADHEAAARTFVRVLELSPGHPRALRVLREGYLNAKRYDALEELYQSQNDWEGLADVLSNAADRAPDAEAKVELSYRAARIYGEKLSQPERAFRSYERILAADPRDLRAARALIPIYESEEKWARLPALYELCLAAAEDDDTKIDLLTRLYKLTSSRLVDRVKALQHARSAYVLAPERADALPRLEEASRSARDWSPFVEVVRARLEALRSATPAATPPDATQVEAAPAAEQAEPEADRKGKRRGGRKNRRGKKDKDTTQLEINTEARPVADAQEASDAALRDLEIKLARVYDEHLTKTSESIALLRGILERDPHDEEAGSLLETLLRREGKRDELRELFDLRVTHAGSDEAKITLLSDWATLERTEFESNDRAAGLYRRVLEVDPAHLGAIRELPYLLLSMQEPAAAAEAIERHKEHVTGADRAKLEAELAELYISSLDKPEAALQAAQRTLEFSPGDERAVAILRRLTDVPATRRRAAGILAENYAHANDARREEEALRAALDVVTEPAERKEVLIRLADVNELKLESYSAAFDVTLKAVHEFGEDLELWDRAERLAVASGRVTELAQVLREVLRLNLPQETEAELCDRAARLYEETLGDPVGAAPYLERLLTRDPANQSAFARLKQILTGAERWGELEDLYNRTTLAIDDVPTRVDLLTEVALVCEEIIEDDAKAVNYYERTLALQPNHEVSLRALDRLYQRTGAYKNLASLLETRLEGLSDDEALDTELRLARVQLEQLHEPQKAIVHVENVLSQRIGDYEARELAESILEIGSLRVRAARVLEDVYQARDEVRELVRVLEIRWSAIAEDPDSDPIERRELLGRIATLKDQRLHDDVGALEAFARFVPEDPLDILARERFLDIGLRRGEYGRVAEVLEKTADAADSVGLRGEILMQAARIYHENLADLGRAEGIYRRVLELDPDALDLTVPAARALERLYEANSQFKDLAEMVRIQIRLEGDRDTRARLLGRLGELSEKQLSDPRAAIDAFRRRLEDVPGDATSLEALDRLYEGTEQWRELVGVLEQRRENGVEFSERQTLMRRQAAVLAQKLGDTSEAIEVWRTYRAEFGDSSEALSALEGLYRHAERWDDLAETYEAHLEIATASDDKLRMLTALGDLRGDQLGLHQPALDAYRDALAIDFSHRPARVALERLLESQDTLTRREAAEVLEPVFEADGDHERLLRVLEIQTESAEDPIKKLTFLQKSADIAERTLKSPERTLGYVTRALREGVGHVDLSPWLERLERVAAETGRREEQVTLLRQIVVDIFEGDVQVKVTERIAELARNELKDRELAREYYEKALELRQDADGPMRALESIYEESGDLPALLAILERRADATVDPGERRALLLRRAELFRDRLQDRERAIEVYERLLDSDQDPEAADALEGLYAGAGHWEQLIELYERQLQQGGFNPVELRVKIARVAARELNDLPRAFESLEAALTGGTRQHPKAIEELEHLMQNAPEPEYRGRAAALLEPIYVSLGNYDRVMAALSSRLSASQDPDERRELLTRLAKLYEEQKEDYGAALNTVARLLEDDISDQTTIQELERLAKVADSSKQLAEIYAGALDKVTVDEPAVAKLAKRTGELFAEQGDLDRSLDYYRRALAFDPEDTDVFGRIDELLSRLARHDERVTLYTSALEYRFEDAQRIQLLHRTAELQREKLAQPDRAIDAYKAALEIDPQDAVSLDALAEIYRELERWSELGELFRQRADSSEAPEEAARYRLELARLKAKELSDPHGAVDELEEIVQALPSHHVALQELERLRKLPELRERVVGILYPLYEATADWRRLIKLNEDRFALAADTSDKVRVLRETAELWERRGEDLDRARRGLAVAFELDPDDADVRRDYERLVEATGAWDELAGVYQERLKSELNAREEVLTTLARVHDEKRNDPRRALVAYEQLVGVDETNRAALEKLEQLATMLSDWDVLVRALRIKTEVVDDVEERASLWRRVGETRRDMLEQPDLAIEAYERALELEPQSTFTIDNLIGLYQQRQEVQRLIELYQRRVELADEEEVDLKYELLCAAGALYEEHQHDNLNAIDVLNQALAVKTGDREVLARVNRLYAAEEMWGELLENLRFGVSIAEDAEERIRLRTRIAQILADKMGEFDEALDSYRIVLEDDPTNDVAISAAQKIGHDHAELREQAAAVLVPALRSQERHKDLVDALEMRLTAESDPAQRAETLRHIASVHEVRLHDPAQAQAALLRSLTEQPDSLELHAEIERLAKSSDGFRAYAGALSERAQSTFDTDLAKFLYATLGRISEQELKDLPAAIEAYEEAVKQSGDQPELLEALDRLYEKTNNYDSLGDILERRASVAKSEYEQADLYYRMAILQRMHFGDSSRSLLSLRRALEYSPSHEGAVRELESLLEDQDLFEEVSETLNQVYRTLNDTTKLAKLYEKRIGLAGSPEERAEARRTLARVLEDEVGDVLAAQRILQQGFVEEPGDVAALDELERLATISGEWSEAANALEQALGKVVGSEQGAGRDVALRLATWRHERLNDDVGAERALGVALECSPDNDDILQQLEELQRAPGRERALIDTLRRRGKLAVGDEREEIFRRAKSLADGLGDLALAEAILRDLLNVDDQNNWALANLSDVSERAGKYAEALDLIERRLEFGAGSEARALRARAAEIARRELKDYDKASALYLGLLDDDPSDQVAASSLRSLYVEAERWQDLGSLLERLIEIAETSDERQALRLELAKLSVERFNLRDSAIDQLRLVLDEEPGQSEVVMNLSHLYEQTGRDEELATLLEQQIQAAEGRGDVKGALDFYVRLGQVAETRLNNPARAIATYQRVLEHEPYHRAAIESLARLLKKENRLPEAADVLERIMESSEPSELPAVGNELAELYEALGESEKASQALERVVQAGHGKPELLARLQALYERLNNWGGLADLLVSQAEASQSKDEKVKLLARAATIHADKIQERDTAVRLLRKATELKPEDRNLLLQLCDVLNASGRSQEAADTLQQIVKSYGGRRSKELGEIHRRLAHAYRAQGEVARALEELDHAFRIEPGNVATLKELGELSFDSGDMKKAQQMYRALLLQRLDSTSPISKAEVFFSLGRVHNQLGETPKARQMLERAVQTDASFEAAKQLLAQLPN
jgi:tetratricopeptide (TPR) repeat protein